MFVCFISNLIYKRGLRRAVAPWVAVTSKCFGVLFFFCVSSGIFHLGVPCCVKVVEGASTWYTVHRAHVAHSPKKNPISGGRTHLGILILRPTKLHRRRHVWVGETSDLLKHTRKLFYSEICPESIKVLWRPENPSGISIDIMESRLLEPTRDSRKQIWAKGRGCGDKISNVNLRRTTHTHTHTSQINNERKHSTN